MYLHLGNGFSVNKKSIVGVFDMENTTVSRNGRRFLKKAQEDGIITDTTDDLPKSYILTEDNGELRVYISSISSNTLLKRSQLSEFNFID